MPSYTFVSTANAFVLRGAVPVFVDIRADTCNLDETLLEAAITDRTRAIVPVHYAGVACEMNAIMAVAERHGLLVIEDAAQGVMARYRGQALGAVGDMGALSFHATKNIISGEGGALLVRASETAARAEVIREKGTNRSRFLRGEVDKYSWVDVGSSYLPSELTAAFLLAQLQNAEQITRRRIAVWNRYHAAFMSLESRGLFRCPTVPEQCTHNAHMYYLVFSNGDCAGAFVEAMKQQGIQCVHHYVPLHSSVAGRRLGRVSGSMAVTDSVASCLVRIPLWADLDSEEQARVIAAVEGYTLSMA